MKNGPPSILQIGQKDIPEPAAGVEHELQSTALHDWHFSTKSCIEVPAIGWNVFSSNKVTIRFLSQFAQVTLSPLR